MPSRIPSTEVPLAYVMAPDSEEDIDEDDGRGRRGRLKLDDVTELEFHRASELEEEGASVQSIIIS